MKRLALIHLGTAYKPEILAYKAFLSKYGFVVEVLRKLPKRQKYDIEWYFTGLDFATKSSDGRVIIHEYTCSSNPPFAFLKDKLKKKCNRKPHARIFGNQEVARKFGFSDGVPQFYRDAGLQDSFLDQSEQPIEPEFDFVYCGSMDRIRRIDLLLSKFSRQMPGYSLLLLGTAPQSLKAHFGNDPKIHFQGYVPYTDIAVHLRRARFGINFIPPVSPLVHQRPLKLIEYCATGLKIVTTDYNYANRFEKERGGRFFKLRPDLSNFCPAAIDAFSFLTPDVTDLTWEKEISKSGIITFLQDRGY